VAVAPDPVDGSRATSRSKTGSEVKEDCSGACRGACVAAKPTLSYSSVPTNYRRSSNGVSVRAPLDASIQVEPTVERLDAAPDLGRRGRNVGRGEVKLAVRWR
jgi:hypothetical protein